MKTNFKKSLGCLLALASLPSIATAQITATPEEARAIVKEAIWLPAPDGPLWMAMRIYWPKKEALDGTWKAPALNKVK